MLTPLLGHASPLPSGGWQVWNADPLTVAALVLPAVLYVRGRGGRTAGWRAWCFAGGLAALVVALLSPLEHLARGLASAHMVQHVLLVVVAAPLVALAAPGGALLRGLPRPAARRLAMAAHATRGRLWPADGVHPALLWVLHVAVLWAWHSAALYDLTLRSTVAHGAEHALFFGTAVLVWRTVARPGPRRAASYGLGVLVVFGLAMQSVLLSLLMTFASAPWYAGYARTAPAFGLDPLADQHLAGAIMWVPAGLVHTAAGLLLLRAWLRAVERDTPAAPEAA